MCATTLEQIQMPKKQLKLPLVSNTPKVEANLIKQGLRFYSQLCKTIPSPIVADYFDVYNLLYWSAKHTYYNIIEGHIYKDGTNYQVIYKGMTRGELLKLIDTEQSHKQIALSFRKVVAGCDLPPVVLLSIAD